MWVFSEIMGLPVEDRRLLIELGDKLLGNTDPEVVGEENVARAWRDRDPAIRHAAVLEPVRARPDRVRLPARRGAATRAARRRHDEARRGRGRRLAARRARVRRVLHPPHDGGQRDDAAHDQPRPRSICSRTPTSWRGSSPTRRSRAPPPTRSCAARTPCTTSAARRRATSSCTAGGSGRATR